VKRLNLRFGFVRGKREVITSFDIIPFVEDINTILNLWIALVFIYEVAQRKTHKDNGTTFLSR
jgi:hypothetical protein